MKDGLVEEFHENGQLSKRENYKDGVLQDEDDAQTDDTSKDKKLDLSNLDTDFWGEILLDYADTLYDEILILDISQDDLINKDDSYIEEIGRVEYGNWDALGSILSDENVGLEKKSAESYMEYLRKNCDCDDEICKCEYVISLASLYCEYQYVWGSTNHSKLEADEDDDGQTEEIKNGLYESFHENGQLSKRENYKDGKLDGLFEWFDESGNLIKTKEYKNGELING